jgi:chitinase
MSFKTRLIGKYGIGAYFQSWSSNWSSSSSSLDLSKVDLPINIVYLCFVNPSCNYVKGSNVLSGTGLDFSSDFNVVKGAVSILKKKGIIVMLSVGGATYHFNSVNYENIFNLMIDIGADGIDIDWEDPAGAGASDKLGPIIGNFRKTIGSTNLLCLAAFSVGAYGSGAFSNAIPFSQNTGMCIKGLQSNGNMLDWINIMSYDASPVYDPIVAFAAYRSYYTGPLMLGCEVPPEAWGGHILNLDEVKSYCKCVSSDLVSCNGIFVWSYQKPGTPSCSDIINTSIQFFGNSPSPVNPTTTPPTPPTPVNPTTTPTPPTPVNPTPTPTPPTPSPSSNNWISGTKYNNDVTVLHNNKKYVCKNSEYSSIVPPGTIVWSLQSSHVPPTPSPTPSLTPANGINSDSWKIDTNYSIGNIVLYNGVKYKCLQSHKSLSNWYPTATPALWQQQL